MPERKKRPIVSRVGIPLGTDIGQSLWLENTTRGLLASGIFRRALQRPSEVHKKAS